jgi:hypothetical protein
MCVLQISAGRAIELPGVTVGVMWTEAACVKHEATTVQENINMGKKQRLELSIHVARKVMTLFVGWRLAPDNPVIGG